MIASGAGPTHTTALRGCRGVQLPPRGQLLEAESRAVMLPRPGDRPRPPATGCTSAQAAGYEGNLRRRSQGSARSPWPGRYRPRRALTAAPTTATTAPTAQPITASTAWPATNAAEQNPGAAHRLRGHVRVQLTQVPRASWPPPTNRRRTASEHCTHPVPDPVRGRSSASSGSVGRSHRRRSCTRRRRPMASRGRSRCRTRSTSSSRRLWRPLPRMRPSSGRSRSTSTPRPLRRTETRARPHTAPRSPRPAPGPGFRS